MRYVIQLMPNPDSEIRLQGEGDTLPVALEAFMATVIEHGSDEVLVDVSEGLGKIQVVAMIVEADEVLGSGR